MTLNLELSLAEVPVVVLDVESTGLYVGLGHRVVEVGAARYEGWQITGEMSRLVNPGRLMDPRAAAVNGIQDADLSDKPPFSAVADELADLVDGALMVAHNAAFDAAFIGTELWLANKPIIENPWLDTLQLARNFFYFGRNSLSHIAGKLGVRIGRAHRALNDVYMTAEVLKRMTRELESRGLHTVGDLLHSQRDPVFCPPPPQVALPALIANALAEQGDVEILYVGDQGETNRRVTPRYAIAHRGSDYLIAWCHLRGAQRSFRVDRIFSARTVA